MQYTTGKGGARFIHPYIHWLSKGRSRFGVCLQQNPERLVPPEQARIVKVKPCLAPHGELFVEPDVAGLHCGYINRRQYQGNRHRTAKGKPEHPSADFIFSKWHSSSPPPENMLL